MKVHSPYPSSLFLSKNDTRQDIVNKWLKHAEYYLDTGYPYLAADFCSKISLYDPDGPNSVYMEKMLKIIFKLMNWDEPNNDISELDEDYLKWSTVYEKKNRDVTTTDFEFRLPKRPVERVDNKIYQQMIKEDAERRNLSSARISVNYNVPNDGRGNRMVALSDFEIGDIILEDNQTTTQVLNDSGYICDFCGQVLEMNLKCTKGCISESYCSEVCRESAFSTHHKAVCGTRALQTEQYFVLETYQSIAKLSLQFIGRYLSSGYQDILTDPLEHPHLTHYFSIFDLPTNLHTGTRKRQTAVFRDLQNLFKTYTKLWKGLVTTKTPEGHRFLDEKLVEMDKFTFSWFVHFYGIYIPNCFSMSASTGKFGVGLFLLASMANHSCCNNANFRSGQDSVMKLRCCQPIKAGDEICISYLSTKDYTKRREKLARNYGFICCCEACKNGR